MTKTNTPDFTQKSIKDLNFKLTVGRSSGRVSGHGHSKTESELTERVLVKQETKRNETAKRLETGSHTQNIDSDCTWLQRSLYPDQLQVIRGVIRRVASGHLSAAADSKSSPRNPVMCIVLHLENIASLSWIFNCKFRPLNSQPLAVQS